ncbi:peptidoglycan-binding domain 1 protein [Tardiphaga sp.]|uniref:peptidoglycan-binding domain 1 protein n=1 Tax=Tardiphaga sp. TaxID=1926292 RepID=UPI00352AEA53
MPGSSPAPEWIETALKVTGHFEDSSDPMGAVSGDFDEMGISLGVLQWNIGSGSLQPLVRKIGRARVIATMPVYGGELWGACNSAVPQGLAIVRGWQVGDKLRPPVKAELKAFTHGASFVEQQVAAANHVAQRAMDMAEAWALEDGEVVDKWLFCWFFDLITQNGGLKSVTHASVVSFIGATGTTAVDDVICDWLASRTSRDAGFRDSHRNADLWRDKVPDERLKLFVASYMRALESRTEYRGDTLNRKATIALGEGWVHVERHNLKQIIGH